MSGNGGPEALPGTCEISMDDPRNSPWLLIGLSLSGKGQVWGRDFRFEEVSRDTPVTQPGAVRFQGAYARTSPIGAPTLKPGNTASGFTPR
jgi:hypothetical protein